MSLNWMTDSFYEKRTMGVEITEDHTSTRTMSELAPTSAWGNLTLSGKQALWTQTIDLPDRNGQILSWQVAASSTMGPYFQDAAKDKRKWMKWEQILFTEDNTDIEWIITHPDEPQGLSYYWDQLQKLSTTRQRLREALRSLNVAGNKCVLAMHADPGPHEVFEVCLLNTEKGSAQITIESTNHDITKLALLEGLSYAMNWTKRGGRLPFVEPDKGIQEMITTLANSWTFEGVDKELVTLFIVGDLCHKVATFTTGPNWNDGDADFKNWRLFFPRSHPYQILLQGMNEHPPKNATLGKLKQALQAQKDRFLDCVLYSDNNIRYSQ